MKKCLLLTLIFTSHLSFALVVTGKAYRDNKLIYIEKHYPSVLNDGSYKSLKTEYLNPKDLKFAEITSDFSVDAFVPNVSFKDDRFGLIETVTKEKSTQKIKIEREIKQKKATEFLELKTSSILGQGFHNFIVKNFDNILKNDVDVYFIITSKADQFHFKMYLAKKMDKEIIIKGKIDSFFLRAFVKEIELTYSYPSKRLLKFKGLSNLDDENGNSQNVEILYEYDN